MTDVEKKLVLMNIPPEIFKEVGELILLFASVEWLIANILLLSEIGSNEYSKVKDLSVTQKYLEVLLSMNFTRKLDYLKKAGYDITQLKIIGHYRNTLSHGLIFGQNGLLTMKAMAKPKADHKELSEAKVKENIDSLKLEGGKLLNFLEVKGYKYMSPDVLGSSSAI